MNKLLVCAGFLLSLTAQAAPRQMVVASGECKDAELTSQARAFHGALKARQDQAVMSPDAFGERLFPASKGSFEDLQRQLDAAQDHFYEARYARAEQAVNDALREISRLPAGDAHWKLYANAQLLHGLNYRSMGKVKESDAAFRNVLRLQPQFQLDPALFAPSIRQAFEKVRGEVIKSKKVKLSVKSTLPASDVFLDGFKVGQTPVTVDVPAGTYDITVVKGSAVSFPRQIQAQGTDTPVLIDLAYEGSVSASPFPCLASTDKADERTLNYAVRLGGALGVEEVIVVRLETPSSGPKWFAATVLNVEGGQKVREGGFKTQGLDAPPDSLSALVDFVTTGKAPPNLVVPNTNGKAPWSKPPSGDAPVASSLSPDVSAPDRLPEGGVSGSSRSGSGMRTASYVAMGAGVAGFAAAGVVRFMAQKDLDALDKHLVNGRIPRDDQEALKLRDSLAAKGNLMTGLLIGSGAVLTTGAVLFFTSPSNAPPPVNVGVSAGPEGASASFSGSF
jgi:hypothetical protein